MKARCLRMWLREMENLKERLQATEEIGRIDLMKKGKKIPIYEPKCPLECTHKITIWLAVCNECLSLTTL